MDQLVELGLRELESVCRKMGARVTSQRREVLRCILETNSHPDAKSVFRRVREKLPTISFDTVYRTLAFLEEHGLIRRVTETGQCVRFDGKPLPHHHFICTTCGRVLDFVSEKVDDLVLPGVVREMGTPHSRQLQVVGTCRDCEEKEDGHAG